MSNAASRSSAAPTPARSLTERVKARVAEAGRTLDNRSGTRKLKHKHLRPTRLAPPDSRLTESSESHREVQSLRWVYCEMRMVYRRYRRRTKRPAVPELRNAVRAFKRGPSLTSLVDVATFLDERQLLGW